MKKPMILFTALAVFTSCSQPDTWKISSPDDTLQAEVFMKEDGSLGYDIVRKRETGDVTVVENSLLGLIRDDGDFSKSMTFTEEATQTVSDAYELVSGKRKLNRYEANESKLSFENVDGKPMELVFRVSDEGVAFRYHFPDENNQEHIILEELTSFNLPDEGVCWSQAYDTISKWTPAYETYFERKMEIGTTAPWNKNGWSFPLTWHSGDTWGMITESNLDGTYPGCHLEAKCEDGEYRIRFPEADEAFGAFDHRPVSSLPWSSPWRVFILGDTPATIIESSMVTDLAEPSKIGDPTWIRPGRAAWSWWSDSPSPQFVKEQNRFTDLAVEMGWEYNLIDANWDQMKDGDVRDAINYANKNGIGAILWYNSGGAHNEVTEAPRDRMWDPGIRAEEFSMLADWGVKGVKVDFFQSDKQPIIQQYIGILKDAAENQVLVNFHGCTLPRGWNRTWPNMVTLESVRGGESYKFDRNYPEKAPWNNTILPFTRNAVGPMDYTPVMFSDHTYPHITTYAHELATSVVFESGITHMADKVEAYLSLPEEARSFLSGVPASWDDIRFIDGYPGEYVILARKKDNHWYVAGIQGTKSSMDVSFSLEFLDEGAYSMQLIMDGDASREFAFSGAEVSSGDTLKFSMLPYGGFVAVISAE